MDILWDLWKVYKSSRICDVWINAENYEENGPMNVREQRRVFSLGKVFGCYNHGELYPKWVKMSVLLIPRENYIVIWWGSQVRYKIEKFLIQKSYMNGLRCLKQLRVKAWNVTWQILVWSVVAIFVCCLAHTSTKLFVQFSIWCERGEEGEKR